MTRNHAVITGGSGFVGSKLTTLFVENGWRVTVLDQRAPNPAEDIQDHVSFFKVDLMDRVPETPIENGEVVVNLAGKNIFTRWNQDTKKIIKTSRVNTTENLVAAIARVDNPPDAFISASATGLYGDQGENLITEDVEPGNGFLAEVCTAWEQAAEQVTRYGVREARVRTAPVLGNGGMLAVMEPFFKLGLGGTIGSGDFYMPWIHINDLARIYFAAATGSVEGAVNAAAPQAVTNKTFTDVFGDVLHRPTLLRIPQIGLKLLYGELADELTMSQKVRPQKLLDHGFEFEYPEIRDALNHVFSNT